MIKLSNAFLAETLYLSKTLVETDQELLKESSKEKKKLRKKKVKNGL